MTSKSHPKPPAIRKPSDDLGENKVNEHQLHTSIMLHQVLPPNTLITVVTTDVTSAIDSSNYHVSSTKLSSPTKSSQTSNLKNLSFEQFLPSPNTEDKARLKKQVNSKLFTGVSRKENTLNHRISVLGRDQIQRNKILKCSKRSLQTCTTADKTKNTETEEGTTKLLEKEFRISNISSGPSSGSSFVHKQTETKKKIIPEFCSFCFVCNMEFGTLDLLEKHLESKQFFCRVCVAEFSNHMKLENHLKSHKPFKCKTCSEVFYSKKDLYEHKIANQRCNNDRKECEICNKKFFEVRCLNLHRKKYHSDSTVGNSEVYKCVVCAKTFNIYQIFNYHCKRIHMAYEHIECKICNVLMVGPDRLKQHMKSTHFEAAEGSNHVCTVCKKLCSTKSLLRNHMEIHDSTVRLCEICGQSIQGKQPMRRHMAKDHSKVGFICKTCKQQFSSLSELRKHAKKHKKPVDESVYCEVCGKKLKNSSTLKIHLRIHSDDKPFKCVTCGACFKQEVTLKTHLRVHSEMGKYFCSVCGMSFRWKQTFDKHVKKCGSPEQNSFIGTLNNQ